MHQLFLKTELSVFKVYAAASLVLDSTAAGDNLSLSDTNHMRQYM